MSQDRSFYSSPPKKSIPYKSPLKWGGEGKKGRGKGRMEYRILCKTFLSVNLTLPVSKSESGEAKLDKFYPI